MKSKYSDDGDPPYYFSPLSPFVATTVLQVSFLWSWLLCNAGFAFGFAEEWDDLLLFC
jgi:hypothetical protein